MRKRQKIEMTYKRVLTSSEEGIKDHEKHVSAAAYLSALTLKKIKNKLKNPLVLTPLKKISPQMTPNSALT